MLHCWNEDPLERPTFTALRDHLDLIMSQSADYFSFDIDQENTYYNVASFNSISSDDEDLLEVFESESAPKIRSVEELKQEKLKDLKDKNSSPSPLILGGKKSVDTTKIVAKQQDLIPQTTFEEERYVKPQALRASVKKVPQPPESNPAYVNTNFKSGMSDLTM